jgi:glycine/D-amino acid oxidase-like deaminating enzyme
MKSYEWAVIGGGIAGIAVSEILAREGHSVVLVDQNQKLASETTRDFHEWIHTGALYTLVPDRLLTLKFILGAVDDLIEYYSAFDRMNLMPTMAGLSIDSRSDGWFSPNYIRFKYRIKGRKIVFPWLVGVARSLHINEKLHGHDWLRRRAGELGPLKDSIWREAIARSIKLLGYRDKFLEFQTTDFTTNSRLLLRDIVGTAVGNGLTVSLGNKVGKVTEDGQSLVVHGQKDSFRASRVAVCAGAGTSDFTESKVTTSYAPIAVVRGISPEMTSFVELDYFRKNCINILTKKNGVGLIGGITVNHREECDPYLDFVIAEHKKLNPDLQVIERYVGYKNEVTFKTQERNYLYHINSVEGRKNMWSIIPGKFTLAFSLAPEFYRRVYSKNPRKSFVTHQSDERTANMVANTAWYDAWNAHKNHEK